MSWPALMIIFTTEFISGWKTQWIKTLFVSRYWTINWDGSTSSWTQITIRSDFKIARPWLIIILCNESVRTFVRISEFNLPICYAQVWTQATGRMWRYGPWRPTDFSSFWLSTGSPLFKPLPGRQSMGKAFSSPVKEVNSCAFWTDFQRQHTNFLMS